MNYSVYLESSIVDLKPRVLDFLTALVNKAKEAKDYAISMKKKEMADLVGKDTRTVSRYLNELEDKKIIQTKGRKGRAGGTVILFNTELIKFNTSEKALINSDNPKTIEEIMEEKMPKKQMEPKEPKRNRRTKQQMVEAQILQNKKHKEIAKLNQKVLKLGGVPNWEWFQETEDPVGNYRTYLLSRLYNRYAVLFTDRHNAEVRVYNEGNVVPTITNGYDVLPMEFYGTARWTQFEKLRKFLEENDIDPATYLSSQFSRSLFDSARKNNKKVLPFVNALIGDTCYEVYKQYCDYQKNASHTYAAYQVIPSQFADDFVVRAITDAYETAHLECGVLELKQSIADFVEGFGSSSDDDDLLGFYRITDKELKDQKVSLKTRDTIKKYLMLQTLILTGGNRKVPKSTILGMEMTRGILVSIDTQVPDKEKARMLKARALGALVHPYLTEDEQVQQGNKYLYQFNVLHETPLLLRLIMGRKNLHLSLRDITEAFNEYGKDKIPVDDFSMLDIDQVINFMQTVVEKQETEEEEINHEEITDKKEWELTGSIGEDDPVVNAFQDFLNEIEV